MTQDTDERCPGCGGKAMPVPGREPIMVHSHPCPTLAAALKDTEDVVARLREWLKATAELAQSPDVDPAAFMDLVGKGAAGLLTGVQSLSDRIDVLEDKLADAYKRGWREGCETLLDDYEISGKPETPHQDAMGEGCGNFMAEYYAALHQEATDVGP